MCIRDRYLGGYDFPISHAEAQGFWMKNALLPGGGAIAIQNSANLGERRFYDPQGWERDCLLYTSRCV